MLWGYGWDALRARWRARLAACWGLQVGPGAQIHPGVMLRHGVGSALGARSILYRDVRVLATAGGRFVMGRDSHMAPGAYLLVGGQQLSIGNDVAIGPGLMVFCESNDAQGAGLFRQQYRRADVAIGNDVFIGARVTLLPGTQIEDRVVVAAHAVVSGRLRSGYVYGGTPARELRRLTVGEAA